MDLDWQNDEANKLLSLVGALPWRLAPSNYRSVGINFHEVMTSGGSGLMKAGSKEYSSQGERSKLDVQNSH
jgi:predicted Rossmann-fold nucleotide-binding protein